MRDADRPLVLPLADRYAKRVFDTLASAAGLTVLSPALVVIALWVKLDSPGPALFCQQRVGRGGKLFRILKFRTMRADAEKHGLQITARTDPRITRSGRILRRTKLDELPQLVNVLRGEMSLVGPRPEVPRYVALWPQAARATILELRPGITDPAAIEFRDEEIILARSADPGKAYEDEILPRKVSLYLQYYYQRSFLGDLRTLVHTLLSLLGKR